MFSSFIAHLTAMGALQGKGTDYPLMWFIYLILMFGGCLIANIAIMMSKHGNRVVWLADQHKPIKSKFNYMAMLACTFTGVFLVGSYPLELQNTFGTWNPDLFYTLGQTAIMLTAGIFSIAFYKRKSSTIFNILSIIIGLSTSIPVAANVVLAPFNLTGITRLLGIIAIIVLFIGLALISVKNNLLIKYSRANIFMFFITAVALATTITTMIPGDLSKVLPFQGMVNKETWFELLTNPYWWYFEATVISWAVFCGRFVAFSSNGYTIKEVIKYGTLSLIILTVVWHMVSAATGFSLSLSRGPIIFALTALTMIAFAVTSLDSAVKTLVNDCTRLMNESPKFKDKKIKNLSNKIAYVTMGCLGVLNIIILNTGTSRVFTIISCLIFIPLMLKAIVYCIKFALGKVDFTKTGTVTKEEYDTIQAKLK